MLLSITGWKSGKIKKGFTLVELIIVIAILAILTAVATVSIIGISNRATKSTVVSELPKYKAAYDAWVAETGGFGTEQDFKNYIDPSISGSTYKISSGIVPTINWNEKTVEITIKYMTGRINLNTGVVTCPV